VQAGSDTARSTGTKSAQPQPGNVVDVIQELRQAMNEQLRRQQVYTVYPNPGDAAMRRYLERNPQ
jgi:hypothetical protein